MNTTLFVQVLDSIFTIILGIGLVLILFKIQLNLKEILLLVPAIGTIFVINGFGFSGAYLASACQIFLLYLIFRDRIPRTKLLIGLFTVGNMACLIDYITGIIGFCFSISFNFQYVISYALYALMYTLVFKYRTFYFIEQRKELVYLSLAIYLYITLIIAGYIIVSSRTKGPADLTILFLLGIQFVFIFIAYRVIAQLQNEELKTQEKRDLLNLINSLEEDQLRLRRFKHDYLNLLTSLRLSADGESTKELLDKLEKYSVEKLGKNMLWQFQDAKNIKDEALQSLIISKLNSIYQKEFTYSFECKQEVEQLPNVDLFDLIRIIGIAYDNAIEECNNLKNIGYQDLTINSMIYQEKPGTLEFELSNTSHKKISTDKLRKVGTTDKKGHEGIGLSNIEKISRKYKNMFIQYELKDDTFRFLLIIS